MADFNLGTVTAYGYAKDKGYAGTEDEFAELMASYAQVAEDAAESAEQAAQSATTATTKAGEAATSATNAANANTAAQAAKTGAETAAQTATTKADEASGSAATATTKAADAATSATNAAQSATTATTKAGESATSATNAAASATSAAGSAQTAQDVADSIPADYSQMSADVTQLQADTSQLKEDLSRVNVGDYAFKIIPDVYIHIGTGNQQGYKGWSASDFVPLTISRYTRITCVSTIAYSVVYDENKTKIKQYVLAKGENYLTSENGAYIRFSAETENISSVKVRLIDIDPTIIENMFKRVVLTHDNSNYVNDLSAFTSDNTDDFNKIDRSCFIPVVKLTSANKPSDFTQGFVLSVKSATGVDGLYQALYNYKGKLLYYRAKWTYGAEWGDFISTAESTQSLQYVEAFKRVAVIGDSITVGFMPNVGGAGGITDTSYSWQNHVFKDAEITTCAKGGASARTFFTDTALNTSLNSIPSNVQCVIIYLGTNPVTDDNDTELPYGTVSDVVASYDATPTATWVGYYSKLIKTVQHICPNTPIIIVGLVLQTQRNPTIELCADECGIIYVDGSQFNNNEFNNNEWNIADNNDWWHCTAIGYIGRSNVFRKAINTAISQNLATFNAIQTIT